MGIGSLRFAVGTQHNAFWEFLGSVAVRAAGGGGDSSAILRLLLLPPQGLCPKTFCHGILWGDLWRSLEKKR